VRIPYLPVPATRPLPSLGGSLVRYRPVLAVLLTGPAGSKLRDGLLDTGADDTVFEEPIASLLGVDLTRAPMGQLSGPGGSGGSGPLRCRYAPVVLRITDAVETYEWTVVIGFVAARLRYNLLGHAGFLQYFGADFDGETHVVTLTPKPSFPGRRI